MTSWFGCWNVRSVFRENSRSELSMTYYRYPIALLYVLLPQSPLPLQPQPQRNASGKHASSQRIRKASPYRRRPFATQDLDTHEDVIDQLGKKSRTKALAHAHAKPKVQTKAKATAHYCPPVPPRFPSMPMTMTLALPPTRPNTNPPSPPLQKQHDPTAPQPTRISPPPTPGAGTGTKSPTKMQAVLQTRVTKRRMHGRCSLETLRLGLGRGRLVFGFVILARPISFVPYLKFLCLYLWSLFIS
jgi:hypothetical protein